MSGLFIAEGEPLPDYDEDMLEILSNRVARLIDADGSEYPPTTANLRRLQPAKYARLTVEVLKRGGLL